MIVTPCPSHPDQRLDVPCSRCGDFVCARCTSVYGLNRLCVECASRLPGPWRAPVRIVLDRFEPGPGAFPAICPNCGAEATARAWVGRFEWPHCPRCAADAGRLRRWRAIAVVSLVAGVLLVFGGGVLAAASTAAGGVVALSSLLAFATAVAFVFRGAVAAPSPGGHSFGPGVQVHRVRRNLFGGGYVLDLTLLRDDYANVFLALNADAVKR